MHLHDRAGTLADMLYRQAPADYRQVGKQKRLCSHSSRLSRHILWIVS